MRACIHASTSLSTQPTAYPSSVIGTGFGNFFALTNRQMVVRDRPVRVVTPRPRKKEIIALLRLLNAEEGALTIKTAPTSLPASVGAPILFSKRPMRGGASP